MAAFDFSPSFAGLNSALSNLGKTIQENKRRDEIAGFAPDIQAGNYNAVAGKLLALGDIGNAATFLKLGQDSQERKLGQEAVRNLGAAIGGLGLGGQGSGGLAVLGQGGSASGSTGSALPAALNASESGGNWGARNNEVGAGGARGHFGRAQFGQARLQEAAAAGAIPQGTTPQQFMQSPELQKAAENWHFADIDQSIRANGYDRLIGQAINGIPITADGLRAVAHLGGKKGLQRFIETRGQYNPSDANGTSLMDYLQLGARSSGVQTASADVPAPGSAIASLDTGAPGFAVPGQPAMTGRTFNAISSGEPPLRPAFEAEGVSQPWMGSALAKLGMGATAAPQAQVLPPSRPIDLRADRPAQGAVAALGQMPPIDRAGAIDIDPNSSDAGSRTFAHSQAQPMQAPPSPAYASLPTATAGASPPVGKPGAPQPAEAAPATTPVKSVSGDDPAKIRADAAYYEQANPEAARQLRARADAVEAAVTRGTQSASSAGPVLSNELPRPTNAQQATEYRETRAMEARQGKIGQIATALANPSLPTNARAVGEIFLKEALEQSKAPDSVKEFMYAKGMGWTEAKTLSEYNADKEKAKKSTADESVEERQTAAARAGLKPGDAGYQSYILTGKMPREDMGPLSATDKKAIMEADDAVQSAQTAIKSLQDAKKLSPQALGGWGASAKAAIANNLWDGIVPDRLVGSPQQGQATAELDNVVTSQALAQLKSIFGAAPTEGERKILLDIQGSIGQPDNVRQKVFDRGIELAQRRLEFNRQRAAELRGGDYYKSTEKRSQGGNSEPQGAAPVPGARQAGDGNWYVPDPNRQGKYLRVN